LLRALLLAATLVLVVACGGSKTDATPTATPDTGAALPSTSGIDGSLFIPSLEIGAPITLTKLVVGEPLPSPDGPRDVAMYDFGPDLPELGGAPGHGGNVVMSGLSLALEGCIGAEPPCNAVFAPLFRVAPGANVNLFWEGETYEYQIVSLCYVPTESFSDDLYLRTAEEQLTMLTGAGSWSSESGWSHVLIAIAKPAPRTAVEPCPEGTFRRG
jgi:hypothetical protein